MTLFDRMRAAAREVASRARFVRVDEAGVERLADAMPADLASA